jgi:hypothetical protein
VRTIHPAARDQVMEFVTSQFCSRLQDRGDMVAITVRNTPSGLSLLHPRVPVPTYPWEWTPSQWLTAADLTLSLCEEALSEGWVLKDATPLNILFVGPRPVLVDVLSFEPWNGSNLWLAYGQFVRTFVLPLLMNRLLGWPLALSLFKRDGYEPAELYPALGGLQRLGRAALWTITIPALIERRNPDAPTKKPAPAKDPELALHVLKRSLASLRKLVRRAMPAGSQSNWSRYEATRSHYTSNQSNQKLDWVRNVLEDLQPARVLDVGANTGEFSALAAEKGARVIALERDAAAPSRPSMPTSRGLHRPSVGRTANRPRSSSAWKASPTSCCCWPSSIICCSWSRSLCQPFSTSVTASPSATWSSSGSRSPIPCSSRLCAVATSSTARSRKQTCSPPARTASTCCAASPWRTAASCSSSPRIEPLSYFCQVG